MRILYTGRTIKFRIFRYISQKIKHNLTCECTSQVRFFDAENIRHLFLFSDSEVCPVGTNPHRHRWVTKLWLENQFKKKFTEQRDVIFSLYNTLTDEYKLEFLFRISSVMEIRESEKLHSQFYLITVIFVQISQKSLRHNNAGAVPL